MKRSRLVTQNRFSVLPVEEVLDTDNELPAVPSTTKCYQLSENTLERPEKYFTRTLHPKTKRHLGLSVTLETLDTQQASDHSALLDSGATALFIHHDLVKEKGYSTRKLENLSQFTMQTIQQIWGDTLQKKSI